MVALLKPDGILMANVNPFLSSIPLDTQHRFSYTPATGKEVLVKHSKWIRELIEKFNQEMYA